MKVKWFCPWLWILLAASITGCVETDSESGVDGEETDATMDGGADAANDESDAGAPDAGLDADADASEQIPDGSVDASPGAADADTEAGVATVDGLPDFGEGPCEGDLPGETFYETGDCDPGVPGRWVMRTYFYDVGTLIENSECVDTAEVPTDAASFADELDAQKFSEEDTRDLTEFVRRTTCAYARYDFFSRGDDNGIPDISGTSWRTWEYVPLVEDERDWSAFTDTGVRLCDLRAMNWEDVAVSEAYCSEEGPDTQVCDEQWRTLDYDTENLVFQDGDGDGKEEAWLTSFDTVTWNVGGTVYESMRVEIFVTTPNCEVLHRVIDFGSFVAIDLVESGGADISVEDYDLGETTLTTARWQDETLVVNRE